MSNQKTQTQRLHNSVNHAIIKCRRGTPAGPGPAAPPDDEQYRGRPLPGGASDRGLTRRQGRDVLTATGAAYSAKHLASLNVIEDCAAELFGPERIRAMAGLVMEYDRAPETALGEMEP